jgi:hypothetical protein
MQNISCVAGGSMAQTSDSREAAIRELEQLLASAAELRSSMRSTEATYRRSLRLLKRGSAVSESLDQMAAGSTRIALTEALTSFELTRHRTRLAFTAAGLAEGMTIGELGRSWRFSRTLASRYAKESRSVLEEATTTPKSSAA